MSRRVDLLATAGGSDLYENMAQGTKKKKDEAAKTSETKAGLMSKNSGGKKTGESEKSKADLENLPKTSKSETGKSGRNEGLH